MLNINHNWSYWLTKSFYICSLFIIITSCHFVFSSTLRLQRAPLANANACHLVHVLGTGITIKTKDNIPLDGI